MTTRLIQFFIGYFFSKILIKIYDRDDELFEKISNVKVKKLSEENVLNDDIIFKPLTFRETNLAE